MSTPGEEGGSSSSHRHNTDALVEATLIRDADEGSHSSHHYYDNHGVITMTNHHQSPPVATPVEEASAAFTVVVEAKPVHEDDEDYEPPATANGTTTATKISASRKLICVVMVVLLAVIVALSVGFVVSAQRQDDSSENGSNNNNTKFMTPAAVPVSEHGQNSMSPTVTPIPVLQRLANNENETLHCGVLQGPGLFYFEGNDTETPLGLDASLVSTPHCSERKDYDALLHVLYECFLNFSFSKISFASMKFHPYQINHHQYS